MPYRLTKDGNGVEEEKGGKWHLKKRYPGPRAHTKAVAYLRALQINVEDAGGLKDKKPDSEEQK